MAVSPLPRNHHPATDTITAGCPADTALGKSINVDFTKGAVNSFTATGNPTYDSSGAHFTVSASGDAPQLTSVFYIMFGKVSITMKSAPGAGIVSTLVLESDDLDEIDLEWLGADDTEVQSNYFGKGDVTTYNRGAFNPAANNQGEFITYTIDWTKDQITWSVGSTVVRVLTPATADANQYPQTPMRVKFGSWSGGDASNAVGTIAWARGPTDYSKGPFTMSVQSIAVTDYSTGTQYKYGDTSGSWESIQAVGGAVNGNAGSAASTVASADVPAITSASPSIPAGLGENSHTDTASLTGWPWVGTATTLATAAATSAPGVPSGWVITSSGKVVPASSAAVSAPPPPQYDSLNIVHTNVSQVLPVSTPYFSAGQSQLPSSPSSNIILETGWDDRGFATTRTLLAGGTTKSYDQQGFLITSTPTGGAVAASATSAGAGGICLGTNCGPNGKIVGTSSSKAAGAKQTSAWSGMAIIGIAAAFAERLLL